MAPSLIYLHGFNSSPLSVKAQQLAGYVRETLPDIQVHIPQLPATPLAAWTFLQRLMDGLAGRKVGVVGSSLGGFWATRLAELYGCHSVVVNPVVHPQYLLNQLLGPQENPYTHEQYVLTDAHVAELAQLDVPSLQFPERIWLLQQQGDEVLDYRQSLAFYHFSRITSELGGNHAFIEFERYCAQIVRFLQL